MRGGASGTRRKQNALLLVCLFLSGLSGFWQLLG